MMNQLPIILFLAEQEPGQELVSLGLQITGAAIIAVVSGLITYLATRPKQKVEITKSQEEIMKGLREDLNVWVGRFGALAEEQRQQEEDHDDLQRKYRNLKADAALLFESIEGKLVGGCHFPEVIAEMEKLKRRYDLKSWLDQEREV